jgi:hypothetical protein
MSKGAAPVEWMRPALDVLYANLDRDEAAKLLKDESKRLALLNSLRIDLGSRDPPYSVPDDEFGDNLLQALLAIRIKFEQDEGREKVELNIAMRVRRP